MFAIDHKNRSKLTKIDLIRLTSSAETEISLAFSSASWRMNLTICWICLETSASFIFGSELGENREIRGRFLGWLLVMRLGQIADPTSGDDNSVNSYYFVLIVTTSHETCSYFWTSPDRHLFMLKWHKQSLALGYFWENDL